MPPDEFLETVLPRIVSSWDDQCFCANPGFQKLLSFNFRDYGIGPTALADSELIIDSIVRQRFRKQHESQSRQGEVTQKYMCPQCGATCIELYAEFSISMYQSTVKYERNPQLAADGLFLVGFYGFNQAEFRKINDFREASTSDEFLNRLKVA